MCRNFEKMVEKGKTHLAVEDVFPNTIFKNPYFSNRKFAGT
jgi:hypothetical protein